MGLEEILQTYEQFGFEGHIDFILKKDGLEFTVGLLDMANPDTDGLTYFGCNCIQNTKISNYKKQLSSSINILGTKNIHNEPIFPAPTLKFLHKSLPINQTSTWNMGSCGAVCEISRVENVTIDFFTNKYSYLYPGTIIKRNLNNSFEIKDYTITSYAGANLLTEDEMFFVEAHKSLTNCQIKVSNIKGTFYNTFSTTTPPEIEQPTPSGSGSASLLAVVGNFPFTSNFEVHNLWSGTLAFGESKSLPDKGFVQIPNINIGQKIYIYWVANGTISNGGNFNYTGTTAVNCTGCNIEITAGETSINSVLSGVRYIDMIKQCSKFINDTPIDAAIYDVGGEHYDNVCFNRALISMGANNTLELIDSYTPAGEYLGQVITNSTDFYMPKGSYFWDETKWVLLDASSIPSISLTSSVSPPGSVIGELRFNESDIVPTGLVYWNANQWQGLEFNKPFITSVQDCFENSMSNEICADYEIQQDKIFFGKYDNFYTESLVGEFPIIPSKEFKKYPNERFKINNVRIGYSTFETNRLSKNTSNDIHTEAEWNIPNVYVENKFERISNYIRSGFSIQAMVDLEIKTPQTADDNDDKVFIEKIVPLPGGTINTFNSNLGMLVEGGVLKISNTITAGTTSDVSNINWILIGFKVGDEFKITAGENIGTYTVSNVSSSQIQLTGGSPTYSGDSNITIQHIYTDVYWQTETGSNYSISNLDNSDLYPNLFYSIKTNLLRWQKYLSSACQFHKDKILKNLYFRNSPAVIINGITDKGDTKISDLTTPIITPFCYELEAYSSFEDILTLMQTLKSDRGYVRCFDIDGNEIYGYIQDLDYTWKTGSLKLKLEEKNLQNCSFIGATKQMISIADANVVKGFTAQNICSDADSKIVSLGGETLVLIYKASKNGAENELKTIGNESLGFGY